MSITEILVLSWILPSLIGFLIFSTFGRITGNPMETWDGEEWYFVILACIFYPIGVIGVFVMLASEFNFGEALIKERKWK